MIDDLQRLADLIRARNAVDREIAALVGRPALPGHVGEYLAAAIFGIELAQTAVNRGSDGCFASGPLAGCSVNVKWYCAFCGMLDIRVDALPDYLLVLAGPRVSTLSSKNTVQPWAICSVYLFDAPALVEALSARGVKVGIASSVVRRQWDEAEVYPNPNNPLLVPTDGQRRLLSLFRSTLT